MDRGIPTEDTLQQMRECDPPVYYLVGTPKGKLTKLETPLSVKPWKSARHSVKANLLDHDDETYVLGQGEDHIAKERSMRRRRLRKYLKALAGLTQRKRPLKRDELHQALGAARKAVGRDSRHVKVEVTLHGKGKAETATLTYHLDRRKPRAARRREGRYLLRTIMTDTDPMMHEHRARVTSDHQRQAPLPCWIVVQFPDAPPRSRPTGS